MSGKTYSDRLSMVSSGNWIAGLPGRVKGELERRMKVRPVSRGETVTSAGSPALHMYRVVSGALKLTAQHANGEESLLAFFVPGSSWAETAIVADRPLHHTTVALTDASVAALDRSDFWELYREHPEIPEALCRRFALALSGTVRNRELRESRSLKQLLWMALSNLQETCTGQISGDWCELSIPLTQSDLAAYFGVTRQSVQAAVTQLKSEQLVQQQAKVWRVRVSR